ncbi:hypothetical protein PF008_g21263 [Phytophthora fragariae]|uniref:Uncharacterized protein n=1 Tax=Phytophthora fragariae TaxID=53985 RepID=A0A6G0QX40_9STRA|nr:hypothetical protein PF008_g21263 [Phytophthora fragariae]
MLEMMVGSLSTQHKMQPPHYAALETSAFDLQLSVRQKQSLQRQGLDLDALNVVAFHAKNLVIPQVKPRSRGAFVTPSMTEGVLLTSVEMREVFNAHAELKAMRAEDTESNRLRRYMKRLEADRMKATKQQTAKQELVERREMRQEDVAALKARRVEQRSDAAQRRIEGKIAARNAKEAQQAANHKSGQDTESNRLRRYMKRLEADRMKATKQQTAKQELVERREMRQEDVAALKARRVEQRSDAAQRRIEGKIAARNAKEAQQAANHKSGRRPAALEGGASKPQRKRRALHDITDAIQNLS